MSYNTLRRIRREHAAVERLAPANRAGNLYYVKLNTQYGQFYKLGFTKSSSVHERFSFAGSDNHELIEKELLFVHLDNAYDVEARLHSHFKNAKSFGMFSAKADMPLYRSGQGELYYKDILKLDRNYSRFKHFTTWFKVTYIEGKQEYKSGLIVVAAMLLIFCFVLALAAVVMPFSWLIDWLNNDVVKAREQDRKRSVAEYESDIRVLIDDMAERHSQQKSERPT